MTPDLAAQVRAVCRIADDPDSPRTKCQWPECSCGMSETMLSALIAAAERRGAEAERKACEFVALCGDLLTKDMAEAEYGARLREHIGTTIRQRGAGGEGE